jgi:hypothetical protein
VGSLTSTVAAEPLYPKGERGRPPIGLERMLRIYFLQQWYGLADAALEDALYDSHALRSFARRPGASRGAYWSNLGQMAERASDLIR